MPSARAAATSWGIGLVTCSIILGLAAPALAQLTANDIATLRARGAQEGWTFTVDENAATAVPLSELCGLVAPEHWQDRAPAEPYPVQRDLPAAFNWHNVNGQDLCPPVRNQRSCGACWAFGTVGPLECNIKIKTGLVVDLSEQWLVSCNQEGWSCNGGWWAHDYHQYATDPCGGTGAVLETDYPYTATSGSCACPKPHAYSITSWAYISGGTIPPVASIKQAILDHGPVSVAVIVNSAFQSYTGGIFNACATGSVNHGVTLVGWNDADGCWIVRNSWGPTWGESGYMRMQYNCSSIGYGACYIVYTPPALTISGYARTASGQALAGVTMNGLPGTPSTNSSGFYTANVDLNWSGTVTPAKAGYTFSPLSQAYTGVTANQTRDYTGTLATLTISGAVKTSAGVGIAGVTLGGLPGSPTTNTAGAYSATVDYGWSGTLTPVKPGWTFVPTSPAFSGVTANQTQDFTGTLATFTISGVARTSTGTPMAGVTLNGLPGSPVTDVSGAYSATVAYGWSGTVTPSRPGSRITPASLTYSAVTAGQTQDYAVAVVGDMNCDGVVSFADINPFVLALSGYSAYHTAFVSCDFTNADCNNDGLVSYADINAFVQLLAGQ